MRDPILVETRDGFEEVSLRRRSCSCETYRRSIRCAHIQEVERWIFNFDRYLAISGLHKQIRRGDLCQVRSWAEILLQRQRPDSLLKYIARICFEESRNVPLYLRLRKRELSLHQALDLITTTRKKWELPYLNVPNSHVENWHRGYVLSNSRPPPLLLELGSLIRSIATPEEAYAMYFHIKRDKSLRPHVVAHLEEIAHRTKNERLTTFLRFRPESSYEFMVCFELLIGLYETEAKERHPTPVGRYPFIPMELPFYHDVHTQKGKSNLYKCFWNAYRERNFQIDDIDLRFSGSLFGCLWRESIFAKKGTMKSETGRDWNWGDVRITESLYLAAFELEEVFYSSFVKKLMESNPNSPPIRE